MGEDAAARYLKKKGYKITARNYRTPHGELDIIAENKEYIVFVEVKTRNARSDRKYGRPADAVDGTKKRAYPILGKTISDKKSLPQKTAPRYHRDNKRGRRQRQNAYFTDKSHRKRTRSINETEIF